MSVARGEVSAAVPRHIAIIMDGNRRWARVRHLPAIAGHRAGVEAARELVRQGVAPDAIDEQLFCRALYTSGLPDPELLIRTGGETRVSNFLLWQVAYAEFHATNVLWPDFAEADLDKALADYASRDRKFGR